MNASTSLRLRLTLIILLPLLAIAVVVGFWQWRDARAQAADLFDKSLLTTALAVAGDLARSGGDALSLDTRDLLADTSGGQVYYHAYAPDGVYVTGFATPPVRQRQVAADESVVFYNSVYSGRPVRALLLRDVTTIDGLSGTFTYTVWQETVVREALLQDMALRVFRVMAVLIGSVAFVVWFGVRYGLQPLTSLEDAISARSSGDLSPIRRPVPPEILGIVARLNALFSQVDATMNAQADFISNAAHQLRNPIAGVLAMAEAVRSAQDGATARSRATDLLKSAHHAKDIANKLLTLERARAGNNMVEPVDLGQLVESVVRVHDARAETAGVALSCSVPATPVRLDADPVMLTEAVTNLIDNALKHGGPALSEITVVVTTGADQTARVSVSDDGIGIAPQDIERVRTRFEQVDESEGSGLGLSIAETVAEARGGVLSLAKSPGGGLAAKLVLPLQRPAA